MADMDPVHQQRFMCTFCATTEAIAEGLSASRAASANNHWKIRSDFCTNADPILMLYKDPIPLLATFAAKYCSGDIRASVKNVCYCTV